MWYEDEQPELVGYIPSDGRPLRSRRMLLAMRIVVAVGIAGLILPGVIGTVMINVKDASEACKRWVRYEDPNDSSTVSFEADGRPRVGLAVLHAVEFVRRIAVRRIARLDPGATTVAAPRRRQRLTHNRCAGVLARVPRCFGE